MCEELGKANSLKCTTEVIWLSLLFADSMHKKEKKRKSYCETVLCLQLVLQFLQLAISLLLFPETGPEICQSLLQAN